MVRCTPAQTTPMSEGLPIPYVRFRRHLDARRAEFTIPYVATTGHLIAHSLRCDVAACYMAHPRATASEVIGLRAPQAQMRNSLDRAWMVTALDSKSRAVVTPPHLGLRKAWATQFVKARFAQPWDLAGRLGCSWVGSCKQAGCEQFLRWVA